MIDLITQISAVLAVLATVAVFALALIQDVRETRKATERMKARLDAVRAANKELNQRPRVRYPSPLPTMKGTSPQ